jgi:hypothetical protein
MAHKSCPTKRHLRRLCDTRFGQSRERVGGCVSGAGTSRPRMGGTQPPNPALRGFVEGCEGKPQPCWYGIMPGVTTAEEAKNQLLGLGYVSDTYWAEFFPPADRGQYDVQVLSIEGNLMALSFTPNANIRLGDIMTPLLTEDWQISFDCENHFHIQIGRNWWLTFENNLPFAEINLFSISWETRPPDNINWRGFTFDWYYKNQDDLWPSVCGG